MTWRLTGERLGQWARLAWEPEDEWVCQPQELVCILLNRTPEEVEALVDGATREPGEAGAPALLPNGACWVQW
jgi:hypothetical protein